jgi:hypothetical protein
VSAFDYLGPLVSILIGLVIADLAHSLHKLFRAKDRVRWHWHPFAAALAVVLSTLSVWWGMSFFDRPGTVIPMGVFLLQMAALTLLYLSASAALPDEVPAEGIDLRAYYVQVRRYFWTLYTGLLVLSIVTSIALTLVLPGGNLWGTLFLNRWGAVVIGITISLAVVRKDWWHSLWLVVLPLWMLIIWSGKTLG